MHKCQICGEEFLHPMQLESHWAGHSLRPVTENSSYLLCLPDGVTPGSFEAAEAFVEAHEELKREHPDIQFHFFPFSYKTAGNGKDPALAAILAIAI